jgi:circadian clock protein KaiC
MVMDNDFVRIESGIPGLDEMVEGGFPFPSVVLVAGGAGAGKTTFALKFLFTGAKNGEQGLYFTTLSEPTQWMLRFARFDFIEKKFFGQEIKYVDLGQMIKERSGEELLAFINEKIAEVMPQRIVIDPITVIGTRMKDDYRTFLFDLTSSLKNWQATTVLTGEVHPGEVYPSEVAYAVDSILLLTLSPEGDARRKYIEVLKMRGTNHLTGKQSIDITREEGIVVLKARF